MIYYVSGLLYRIQDIAINLQNHWQNYKRGYQNSKSRYIKRLKKLKKSTISGTWSKMLQLHMGIEVFLFPTQSYLNRAIARYAFAVIPNFCNDFVVLHKLLLQISSWKALSYPQKLKIEESLQISFIIKPCALAIILVLDTGLYSAGSSYYLGGDNFVSVLNFLQALGNVIIRN